MTDIPDPVLRPGLAHWMWARDLTPRDVEARLGCSYQTVRRICLPFDHPERRLPDEPLLSRIAEMTGGAITVLDFYPPKLRDAAAASLRAEPPPEALRLARAH